MESRVFLDSFTLAWEQRKLGDIVGIYDGVHQTPNYQNSGVMFLSVENIATLKSSKFISEEDFKRDYKVFPQENDILMTRIGDVGTTNVVTDNGLKAYYVSLALLKYKSTDPYFLSNAIQSDYVQKGLANRTLKTAIPMKINKDEIGKVSVMLPLSATEQQQIGTCFRNLDNLITLHQCKESAFSEWKDSGFLQKHKTTWEQRKLESLVIDHNAGVYIRKEDYGSGTNVIGVGNIYDNDIFDGEIYRLGPVNDDKFLLEENDLIYGESSLVPEGIARTVCVGKNGAGSAFAWHTRRVKLDQNIVDSHFATLELNYNVSIRKYLMSVSTQTALTGMTTEGYFGATLVLPSVKEQAVISEFFKNLDHLITLHQRKPFCINRRQKWKQTTKMQNYSANIMQNGFQYIRKGR